MIKVVAFGVTGHPSAYLRNGWNWLDLIVIIVGWLEIVPNLPNLKALRTLRVLRPLRSINSVPGLKKQVVSLIKSFGQLANVVLFFVFFFVLFGILGMELFKGQFYQRCRFSPTPDEYGFWPVDES